MNLLLGDGRSLGLTIRGGAEYGLGIYITGVDPGSEAEGSGLKVRGTWAQSSWHLQQNPWHPTVSTALGLGSPLLACSSSRVPPTWAWAMGQPELLLAAILQTVLMSAIALTCVFIVVPRDRRGEKAMAGVGLAWGSFRAGIQSGEHAVIRCDQQVF